MAKKAPRKRRKTSNSGPTYDNLETILNQRAQLRELNSGLNTRAGVANFAAEKYASKGLEGVAEDSMHAFQDTITDGEGLIHDEYGRVEEQYKALQSDEGFAGIMNSVPKELINVLLLNGSEVDPEKVSAEYKGLAKLHAELQELRHTFQYLEKGQMTKDQERDIKTITAKTVLEYYDEQYKGDNDPEAESVKTAITRLYANNDELRERRFSKIAIESLKKKQKEYDSAIDGLRSSGKLGEYISQVVPETEDRDRFYESLVNLKQRLSSE